MDEKKIFINGKFLCQRITGVQRYALEIVKCIDKNALDYDFTFYIIAPKKEYVVNNIEFKNIKIIHTKGKPNYYWEQVILSKYCRKNKPYDLLNLCNVAPIMYPGSCVIHDLAIIDAPKGYSFKQRFIYKLINKLNVKKYNSIFTVSNTMKNRIQNYYNIDNVEVIFDGYNHIKNIEPKKPDIILPDNYYFSVGSMNPNKNFSAILRIATENPDKNFVVSGMYHKSFKKMKFDVPKNVLFTGYLSDENLIYMYKNCDAFLFPSNYEGFGIPPLEALVSGCKLIVCNKIPVLQELFSDFCLFYDFNARNDLNFANFSVNTCYNIDKFDWNNNALKLLDILLRR